MAGTCAIRYSGDPMATLFARKTFNVPQTYAHQPSLLARSLAWPDPPDLDLSGRRDSACMAWFFDVIVLPPPLFCGDKELMTTA